MRFFFTYGSDESLNNHRGGWTEVLAKNEIDAKTAYESVYGNTKYCVMYNEKQFNATAMPKLGNFKSFGHDIIHADAIIGVRG